MKVSLVVAVAENGVIGVNGQLPWYLPSDLKRFKRLTMGSGNNAIIMGRKTYESIGTVLPGRQNIIVTRNPCYAPGITSDHLHVVCGIETAIERADTLHCDEAFIIGGCELYEVGLGLASDLHHTLIRSQPNGDTYFSYISWQDWREVESRPGPSDESPQSIYSHLVRRKYA